MQVGRPIGNSAELKRGGRWPGIATKRLARARSTPHANRIRRPPVIPRRPPVSGLRPANCRRERPSEEIPGCSPPRDTAEFSSRMAPLSGGQKPRNRRRLPLSYTAAPFASLVLHTLADAARKGLRRGFSMKFRILQATNGTAGCCWRRSSAPLRGAHSHR